MGKRHKQQPTNAAQPATAVVASMVNDAIVQTEAEEFTRFDKWLGCVLSFLMTGFVPWMLLTINSAGGIGTAVDDAVQKAAEKAKADLTSKDRELAGLAADRVRNAQNELRWLTDERRTRTNRWNASWNALHERMNDLERRLDRVVGGPRQ